MIRGRFILALSLALSAGAPANAAADAPWSDPVGLGPSVARVASPSLMPASPTTTLLTWRMRLLEPATPLAPSTDRAVVATRGADGTLVRRTLRDDLVCRCRAARAEGKVRSRIADRRGVRGRAARLAWTRQPFERKTS